MKSTITVCEVIFIAHSPEKVWDYTQNYDNRLKWDKSLLKATVIENTPTKLIEIKAKGGLTAQLCYKLYDRPRKTSLAMQKTKSPIFSGGGGSWKYEPKDNGTLWTQTNTLVLKNSLSSLLLTPIVKWLLRKNTKEAMKLAKRQIEYTLK